MRLKCLSRSQNRFKTILSAKMLYEFNLIAKKLSRGRIALYLQLWPIATFVVLLMGYIGFYTYSSRFRITFPSPDISLILGIGIYNLVIVLIAYFTTSRRKEPRMSQALFMINYVYFLTINPIIVAGVALIHLQLRQMTLTRQDIKKLDGTAGQSAFARKRKMIPSRYKWRLIGDLVVLLLAITFTIFINVDFMAIFGVVYAFQYFIFKVKTQSRPNPFAIFLTFILTPLLTAHLLFTNINFTLFGLAREKVVLYTAERNYTGIINYKSQTETYFFDSDSARNLVIPSEKIIMTKKVEEQIRPLSGIDWMKEIINKNFKGSKEGRD